MKNKSIRTEAEYRQALAEIEGLMNAERDTPEGERLDGLVTLVEAYEEKYSSLTENLGEGANQARAGQFVDQSLEEMLDEFKAESDVTLLRQHIQEGENSPIIKNWSAADFLERMKAKHKRG